MDQSAKLTQPLPLTMAAPGQVHRIARLVGGSQFEQRMLEMGLGPGRELRVLQRQGSKLVLALGEARIAIGMGMAQKIMLTSVDQNDHERNR